MPMISLTRRFAGARLRPSMSASMSASMGAPLAALSLALIIVLAAPAPAGAEAEAGAGNTAFSLDVTEQTSPNGITFWHVEAPEIPIVDLQARFDGGARLDTAEKAGAMRLVMGLLDEGAGDRDAIAFADEALALNARFGFSTGREAVRVSARMLADRAQASAALLNEALTQPRFDADAIERVRTQALAGIAAGETDPRTQARLAFYAGLFGEHPYARPVSGTAESVAAITREDLVAAHGRAMALDRAYVAVVGAIDAEAAGLLVDTAFAGIAEEASVALPAPPEMSTAAGIQIVDLDIPQSVLIWGQEGLERSDPDFLIASVMNYILGGGGFSSRLMTEVREKRGLAYGVSSSLSPLDGAPLYVGSVQTANERIGESLEVIRQEWQRMAKEGVSEAELAAAQRYLTGAFALRFDSNAKITGYLVAAQRYDLGLDYIDRRNGLMMAVTTEDIARLAARLLRPDALSIVVVGKPAGL